jgi:hypothetical protein
MALLEQAAADMARLRFPPPTLLELSFQVVLARMSIHPPSAAAMSSLPEHVVLELFEGVMAKGMLNEQILVGPDTPCRHPEGRGPHAAFPRSLCSSTCAATAFISCLQAV